MERTLEGTSHVTGCATSNSFLWGLGWGFLGGLAGTLVMDFLLMAALLVLRQPATLCFSIVGDTVSRFLAMFGTQITGGVPTGVVTHYVVGPLFGAIFGTLEVRIEALRVNTLKKSIILAIIYIEILSQPILATTPILLRMTVPVTLQWYGGSFIMHLLMAVVLGSVVGFGLRLATAVNQRRSCR